MPKPLIDYLKSHNWAPLAMPDSNYTPGAILSVTTREVRLIGHLQKDCFPEGVDGEKILGIEVGSSPGVQLNSNKEFGLNVLSQLYGINFTGSLSVVRKATLNLTDYGIDRFSLIRLKGWENKTGNKLTCANDLRQADVYVVQEAFVVRKGTYTLTNANNATIRLDVNNIRNVNVGVGVTAKATSDGKLEVEKPIVFAVKEVAKVGAGPGGIPWIIVTSPGRLMIEPVTGDEQIEKLFFAFKGAPMK